MWPRPGKHLNLGYIQHWAGTNMSKWDVSIERRGGGLDSTMALESQEIALTNLSSLYAFVATVVQKFYQGTLTTSVTSATTGTTSNDATSIATWAKSIRVLLFLGAEVADIDLLNGCENIEQQERKSYGELDNIATVQDRMSKTVSASPVGNTIIVLQPGCRGCCTGVWRIVFACVRLGPTGCGTCAPPWTLQKHWMSSSSLARSGRSACACRVC